MSHNEVPKSFPQEPKARADVKTGTLYAISGVSNWIYYGQKSDDRTIGFFRRRDRQVANSADILSSPIMSRLLIFYDSVGRAFRSGAWKKLGRYATCTELRESHPFVQWPVGTLDVTVWVGGVERTVTRVEDPAIQYLEIMAFYDAEYHVPERLAVDFDPVEASQTVENAWAIGGPIWRERRVREERARRHPSPWNELPADWVPTG